MIDTSVVRVHQHGACIAGNREQHMGRSRGGLTSKIHAVVDANGLPVQLGLTPGEAHDNRLCSVLLTGLQPRTMLLADRGYDADWIRALASQQGAWANIPPKRNRKASWYLDDLPPMMFIKGSPNSHGFVNPRHIEEIWRDQFDWVYREYDYAVFTFTIHPDVSGRPQVQLMLERLIEHISSHDGITWANFDTIAEDFKKRHPRP